MPPAFAGRNIRNATKYNYKAEQFILPGCLWLGSCQSVLSVFRIFVLPDRFRRLGFGPDRTGVDLSNVDCSGLQGLIPCCVRVNSMVKLLRAHGGCLGRNRR